MYLAETGFDVRSRRRNRPRAGPAKNGSRLASQLIQLRGADDVFLAQQPGLVCEIHTPEREVLGHLRQLPDEPFHGLKILFSGPQLSPVESVIRVQELSL